MDLDIRQALVSHAVDALDPDQLMAELSTRLDREAGRTRRRAAMVGAAAVVALAAAAGAYPQLARHVSTGNIAAGSTTTTVSGSGLTRSTPVTRPSVGTRGANQLTSAVVLSRATPAPHSWGFSAGLMPRGWKCVQGTVGSADPAFVAGPSNSVYTRVATARTVTADNSIVISLDADYTRGSFPDHVGTRPARIRRALDRQGKPTANQTLEIKQARGVLTVQLPASLTLTHSQLLRLGASITVRTNARISHG